MSSSSNRCHSCRRSRLRCDGRQPTCLKCDSRGVECLGYGAQPFLWIQPRGSAVPTSAESNNERGTISPAVKRKGRPKMVLMQSSKDRCPVESTSRSNCHLDWTDKRVHRRKERSSVELGSALSSLLPAGYADALRSLDVLVYYNTDVCPDMIALHSSRNPHYMDPEVWHVLPDIVLQFYTAVVATHRVVRSRPYYVLEAHTSAVDSGAAHAVDTSARRLYKFTHPLVKTIYKLQQQVIKGLGMIVDDEELRFSDIALGIVAGLMLFEIQQSAYGAWRVHLEAMRMIISQRGGFGKVVEECSLSDYTYHLHMFMLIDIISCVTTPSSALCSRVTSQLDYIEYLPRIHRNGLDAGFPCPNTLLEAIIERLLERVISFSPADWARSCIIEEAGISSFDSNKAAPDSLTADPHWNDLQALASAFQAAVLLYGLRTLVLDRDSLSCLGKRLPMDVHSIRSEASDSLLVHLRQLFSFDALQRKPALGKFLSWPFFIAGMECDYSDSQSMGDGRSFIAESLCRISYMQGDMSWLDAVSFLQYIWKVNSGELMGETPHGAEMSWDERVAMLRSHSLFK